MEILLECTDMTARQQIGNLVKHCILTLKDQECEKIFEIETKDGITQHSSLVAKFIMKCLSLLNTQVAKNWSRFDSFLELISAFGCGIENIKTTETGAEVVVYPEENGQIVDTLGLRFLLSVSFVERACDFMLGKKSPLCTPGEKRVEMGGSFSSPNFAPVIKILTKILTNTDLLSMYPLSDIEKKMFLNAELLKVMLSA